MEAAIGSDTVGYVLASSAAGYATLGESADELYVTRSSTEWPVNELTLGRPARAWNRVHTV
jgi:hypothetical protein